MIISRIRLGRLQPDKIQTGMAHSALAIFFPGRCKWVHATCVSRFASKRNKATKEAKKVSLSERSIGLVSFVSIESETVIFASEIKWT